MYAREILDMCDKLDIDFSLRFIFPQKQTHTSADIKKYKIHVLSIRNDVEYLGVLNNKIRVASGNIHHIILGKRTCMFAAQYGHLDILKYARENGCLWDYHTCLNAARYGHLDCLKYAHENGCPWNRYICSVAAYGSHLDCLKYAHENGCPWSEWTYVVALRHKHQHIIEYLIANNCPR